LRERFTDGPADDLINRLPDRLFSPGAAFPGSVPGKPGCDAIQTAAVEAVFMKWRRVCVFLGFMGFSSIPDLVFKREYTSFYRKFHLSGNPGLRIFPDGTAG
jgi:hypothetical protein